MRSDEIRARSREKCVSIPDAAVKWREKDVTDDRNAAGDGDEEIDVAAADGWDLGVDRSRRRVRSCEESFLHIVCVLSSGQPLLRL